MKPHALGCTVQSILLWLTLWGFPLLLANASPSFPLVNELNGQPIDAAENADKKKIIVLIHGWISKDGVPLSYNSYEQGEEWYYLVNTLKQKLQNSDWQLVTYHWEQDAATGSWTGIGDSPAGLAPAQLAATNAYHKNGVDLGDELDRAIPDLRLVHFIAHSAGSWAARKSMEIILSKNPFAVTQMTLLDPFVPGEAFGGYIAILDRLLMDAASMSFNESRIHRIENYYADDSPTDGWNPVGNSEPTGFTVRTQEEFFWRDAIDVNERLDTVLRYDYDYHSGPTKFYADTVRASIPGETIAPGLSGLFGPYEYSELAYYKSLYYDSLVSLPRITQQPQALNVINAGESVVLSVIANRGIRYQWYKNEEAMPGKTDSTLLIEEASATDIGDYVVQISNDNNSGRSTLFSATAKIKVVTSPEVASAPSSLAANAVSSTQVNLSWSESTSATGYKVERRQGSGGWQLVANISATNFSDSSLSAQTSYAYRVSAYNSHGESGWSTYAPVTTLAQAASVRVLTVQSTAPTSTYITLSTDGNGLADGNAPLLRSYSSNKIVTLVAPLSAGGLNFLRWRRDGVDSEVSPVIYVTMDTNHTVTAVYASAPTTRTLTGLTINGPESVSEGKSATYTSSAVFSDGSTENIAASWSLGQNGAPASISASGVLDAGAVATNTIATLRASYPYLGAPLNATKSVTITNVDSAQRYELGLSVGNHGQVLRTPNQNWFPAGAPVTLRAVADTNYRFTGWGGDAASFGTTNPITITMNAGQNITAGFVYDNLYFGPVTVTLSPAGAVAAGAQWRLGNGPWQNSGATVIPDSNGDNNLFFSTAPGYSPPATQPIQIVAGQNNTFSGTYVSLLSPGTLQVTLQPEGAVAAGAKWRPAGGDYAWQESGATVTGLTAGVYALEFNTTAGWSTPAAQAVTVSDGRSSSASAVYGPPAGTPALYSVLPANGPITGGTIVTLDGANFTAPIAVYFNDTLATSVTVNSTTQVTAIAPPRATAGTVAVRITTGGGEAIQTSGFTYGPTLGAGMQLELSLGGSVTAVDVLETRAYVGQGASLIVFDVTNPTNPTPVGRFTVPYAINDVAVYRGADNQIYAALAGSVGGLLLVDVTNPSAMALKSSLQTGGEARDIYLLGGMAYMADGYSGLAIIDLTNPAKPVLKGTVSGVGYAANVFVEANANGVISYIADAAGNRVHFIDVSVPEAPVVKGAYVHGYGWTDSTHGMAKKGNILYFSLRSAVILVDVTDLTAPALAGNLAGYANSGSAAFVQGNTLYSVRPDVGVDVFDISNPRSPSRLVNFAPANVQGWAQRAAFRGNHLYLAGGDSGLTVINVSSPSSPSLVANNRQGTEQARAVAVSGVPATVYAGDSGGDVNIYAADSLSTARFLTKFTTDNGGGGSVAQSGNLLFAADGGNGIYVLDVTSPNAPVTRGRYTSAISYKDMDFHSGRLVIAGQNASNYTWGLWVVDVSNPTSPTTYGTVGVPSAIWNVAVSGNKAVAASGSDGGLRIFDLSDPRNPKAVGTLEAPGFAQSAAISADGQVAYVAQGNASGSSPGGFLVVDVSNSQNPSVISNVLSGQYVGHLSVSGHRLVVSRSSDGVTVYDIANPRSPVEIGRFNTPGSAVQARISGDRVYVADGSQGVAVLTLLDAVPPTVTITNPVFANTYTATSSTLSLGGVSSDDKSLARVVWTNDRGGTGAVVGMEDWTVSGISLQPGTNVIKITAFDATGNAGFDTLTVSYMPADAVAPTLSIVTPTLAETFVAVTDKVSFGGIAHDNIGLAEVTWANSRGGGGTATGTAQWTVPEVNLSEGPNPITVTARDFAGNTTTATMTVSYAPPDTTLPVTTISFPTINATYQTNSGSVNLSGTSSDNRGVVSVRWTNDRGGQGTIAGGPIWSVNAIPLQTGVNLVTVLAEDAAGNSSGDTIIVTYAVSLVFDVHPTNRGVAAGGAASFTAVTNEPSASIQWQVSTDGGSTWMNLPETSGISGVTSGTLSLAGVSSGMSGNRYRAVASAGASSAESNFAVLTVSSPFDAWRQSRFTSEELANPAISSPTADPDSDGLANLIEYALGFEPKTATNISQPEVAVGDSVWTYTYKRPSDRSELSYTVQRSNDLTTWTTDNITLELVATETATGVQTWRASVPLTAGSNLFFRLKVEAP